MRVCPHIPALPVAWSGKLLVGLLSDLVSLPWEQLTVEGDCIIWTDSFEDITELMIQELSSVWPGRIPKQKGKWSVVSGFSFVSMTFCWEELFSFGVLGSTTSYLTFLHFLLPVYCLVVWCWKCFCIYIGCALGGWSLGSRHTDDNDFPKLVIEASKWKGTL